MRRQILICLLLAGVTLGLYWSSGGFDRVYFDDPEFLDNPEVQSGINGQSFMWALTAPVAANWHPITTLSFVVTHQIWGNKVGAEHLVNVAIHALNAVLLFLVLQKLTGIRPISTTSEPTVDMTWPCAIIAALFAWHPMRVESVAWIAERKDVLCTFFMLLALWQYVQVRNAEYGAQNKESGMQSVHYWLCLLFFALGLLSKAMVVTFPFLLVLLDIWPLRRWTPALVAAPRQSATKPSASLEGWRHSAEMPLRLLVEKWPFFVLTLVFCVLTFIVQRHSDATPSLHQLSFGLRMENVIVSYWRYLGWSLWPAKLAAYYTFPYDSQTYHFYLALWPDWVIGIAALALVAVSAWCIRQISRRPYLAVGWFWYLGTLVPVIGFVQVGSQGMADRYTYIPLIGPVISVVWLIWESFGKFKWAKPVLGGLAAVVLAACLWRTSGQLQYWKNSNTLFQHTIEVTGENPRAEYILGLGYENQGDIQQAMIHYRNAITSQPRVKEAFYAIARLLAAQGQWDKAAHAYSTLLEDNPNDFAANLGLATTLPHLNQMADAEAHLKTAEAHCPDDAQALNNLAWTLATSPIAGFRDGPRAVKCSERACQLTGYKETIMVGTLGAAYAEAGRFDEAIATAQKACDLAEQTGKANLLQVNQQLLELYKRHQPYREP